MQLIYRWGCVHDAQLCIRATVPSAQHRTRLPTIGSANRRKLICDNELSRLGCSLIQSAPAVKAGTPDCTASCPDKRSFWRMPWSGDRFFQHGRACSRAETSAEARAWQAKVPPIAAASVHPSSPRAGAHPREAARGSNHLRPPSSGRTRRVHPLTCQKRRRSCQWRRPGRRGRAERVAPRPPSGPAPARRTVAAVSLRCRPESRIG